MSAFAFERTAFQQGAFYTGYDYRLTADAGTYSLTGTSIPLRFGRSIFPLAGAYAVTGNAASLRADRQFPATAGGYQGQYSYVGFTAHFLRTYVVKVISGIYNVSGQNAALVATRQFPSAGAAYTLTGKNARLATSRRIGVTSGSYSQTGYDVAFSATRAMYPSPGSYSYLGNNARVAADRQLAAATDSYALTGQAVSFRSGFNLFALPGQYAFNGYDAALVHGYWINAGQNAQYTVTGSAARLLQSSYFYTDSEVIYVPDQVRTMAVLPEERYILVPPKPVLEEYAEDRTVEAEARIRAS